MSLEKAGEFLLEMQGDEDATRRADDAYLSAVQQIATERGYEVSATEIRDAMRAIAGLDDDGGVEGYALGRRGGRGGSLGISNDTLFSGNAASIRTPGVGVSFSPLGFMK